MDEVDYDVLYEKDCQRYYTNIIGKFRKQVTKVMEKVSKLDLKMIAPLHGLVWRKELSYIRSRYANWSAYEPEKKALSLFMPQSMGTQLQL